MKITIRTIPHAMQRYDTAGDWWFDQELDGEHLVISVSDLGDWRMEALIAVHELVEAVLSRDQDIPQIAVDTFDMRFEQDRREGEPGDAPDSPYRNQHCFAASVERMFCAAMNIAWSEYERAINRLEHPSTE